METPAACAVRTLSSGGYLWSAWQRTLRMQCQLSRNVQKDPAKETHPKTETRSSAPGARKRIAHAWLRRYMLQKHHEKQLSRGGEEAQDALVSDGEAEQEEQQQTEFVCQQCHRVLKSKTWLTRHKCKTTSHINSEDSNVEEQSVTVARPICSKEYHYRWLLRHILAKHPGHDES
ncbi:hypothetical protein TRVL_05455 [Trypanosoma vivax]|nr:hypothetical protein TRVL_05455 [Trypanosoma vivax]